MHQLGLLRALRAVVIFTAAIIVSAQILAFINGSDTRAAALEPAAASALPERVGAVGFDGAPAREGSEQAAALSEAHVAANATVH